ncbi:MAG: hypothetical protein UY63_C0015G0011 [Parcubacteria group bacterium GW2011_GWA2_51_10]|nr:MAG: hypothetical protein UY63_C0015G0011 [Parcubacteria group bacterium GW2011_GWA2_51_10]
MNAVLHDPATAQRWGNRAVYLAACASALFAGGALLIMSMYLLGGIEQAKMPAVVLGWSVFCLLDVILQAAPILFRAHSQGMGVQLDKWTSLAPSAAFILVAFFAFMGNTPLEFAGKIFLLEAFLVAVAELLFLDIGTRALP